MDARSIKAAAFSLLLALAPVGAALGQGSEARPTVPGYWTTAGCPSGNQTSCWFPYTGGSQYHYLTGSSTNSTNVKASGGQVFQIVAVNTTTTIYYLKFYDKATAPTCNSDTVGQTYPLPPLPATGTGNAIVISVPFGMQFSNGIGFCVTGGIADNDNTNAAAGVAVNLVYR